MRLVECNEPTGEKFETETHLIAGEAQKWLDEITPEKFSGDIDRVLDEHWKNTDLDVKKMMKR